jgi:hypothetical protein
MIEIMKTRNLKKKEKNHDDEKFYFFISSKLKHLEEAHNNVHRVIKNWEKKNS